MLMMFPLQSIGILAEEEVKTVFLLPVRIDHRSENLGHLSLRRFGGFHDGDHSRTGGGKVLPCYERITLLP